jgi:dihydrofolate reductase
LAVGNSSAEDRTNADCRAGSVGVNRLCIAIGLELTMSKVRVAAFSVSLDGYGAGPDQSLDHPLGVGGEALHGWVLPTRTFMRMQGQPDGSTGLDEDFAARSFAGVGAWILGRNMFAPTRGPWTDDGWKGWWGDEPPYHCDVFVLTHHARDPLAMAGGTTFHFVTDGPEAALDRARAAAGGLDVRIGGGAATIRQYLRAALIDEMHLAMVPTLLGSGEPLLAGLDLPSLGYAVTEHAASDAATHVVIGRKRA